MAPTHFDEFQQWHFVKTDIILIFNKISHINPRAQEKNPNVKANMAPGVTPQIQSKSWGTGFWASSTNFHHIWRATIVLVLPSSIVRIGFLFLLLDSCSLIKANISLAVAWRMPALICLSHKNMQCLFLAATPFPSGNFWRWKVISSILLMQSFGSVILNAWTNARVLSSILTLAILPCWRDKCFLPSFHFCLC